MAFEAWQAAHEAPCVLIATRQEHMTVLGPSGASTSGSIAGASLRSVAVALWVSLEVAIMAGSRAWPPATASAPMVSMQPRVG